MLVVPVKQHSYYNRICNTSYFQVKYTVHFFGNIFFVPKHGSYHESIAAYEAFIHQTFTVSFSPAIQFTSFQRGLKLLNPSISASLTLFENISPHLTDLIVKYWKFLSDQCLSLFANKWTVHITHSFIGPHI